MTVFTPPQIGDRWSCKPETVIQLIKTGRLRGFTISPPGAKRPRWRVSLDAVLEYEAGELQAKPTPQPRRKPRRDFPAGPF